MKRAGSGAVRRASIALFVLTAITGVGCGSGLSREELRSANVPAFQASARQAGGEAAAASATVPGSSEPAPAAASTGSSSAAAGSSSGSVALRPSATAGKGANTSGTRTAGAATAGDGNTRAAGASGQEATPGSKGGSTTAGAPLPNVPGSAAGPSASGAKAEIRLGIFGIQSGPLGQLMLPYLQGAKAWAADVNSRGGLNGHPVRLINADDGGNPNQALAVAKRMVEEDKVQAFYAIHAPTTLQAVTPYLEQKKVPAFGTCPCNPIADVSPMNFSPQTSETGLAWEHLAPLLTYSDKRKAALLYCREVSLCSDLEQKISKFAGQSGVEIVYKGQVSLAQPDYTAEVLQAKNAGAESVIMVMDNASVIRALRSAHRQNYHPLVSVQRASYDERFLRDGGAEADGVFTAATVVPFNTSPALADFRAAAARFLPGAPLSTQHAEAWATGKMLELMARSFPADVTAQDFLDAVYGLHNETVGGLFPPLTFARDAGHGGTNQCVIPVKIEGGKFLPASNDQWVCAPGWKPVGQ
jgi:branched-chain amino acid transport system substrate-binding protein